MPQFRAIRIVLSAVVGGWLAPAALPACNVPVFRYALERWTPDPYVAVVFYREPLQAEQQNLVEALEKAGKEGGANLLVLKANVSGDMSAPLRALWRAQPQPVLPWLVVRYPAQTGIEPEAWSGPLDAEVARTLVDSPARREIARRLFQGDSAVWLLLESGNQEQDDALARTVETESRKLEGTLKLPQPSPGDPPIIADLPLRISFSTLRVARSDPAERFLVAQLVNWNRHGDTATKPMLFPVFGRGRTLPPAIGTAIRSDVLGVISRMVTGPCSCQVKQMNAGFDLLMAMKWDALIAGRPMKAPEEPALTGISQFASVATARSEARPEQERPPDHGPRDHSAPPPRARGGSSALPRPAEHDPVAGNLLLGFSIGAVLLAIATMVLTAKGKPQP
ncbi:MAG TPA: hypothetical protein VN829_15010 [Dongiaceae bacterium]|nr:hypothetical protein [Dongiaceae bacterium]